MPAATLPLPPSDLAARVGTPEGVDPSTFYLEEGARLRGVIDQLLPPGWGWDGKRALDFGCGAARVLRQFAPEADRATFAGCDIDSASIDWARTTLSPPFEFFHSALEPPLALETGSLDLIWAMSVFTHIGSGWAAWLAEMQRLLAPGGILVASYLGEGMWEPLVGEAHREDEVGMTVMHSWEGPDAWVFHSEWWLREHWGRGFDVIGVLRPPVGSDGRPQITHSYIALRRQPGPPATTEELERIDGSETRETAGLQTSLRLAHAELERLAAAQPSAPRPTLRGLLRRFT
jgi:SAM-dependent methyltransferase